MKKGDRAVVPPRENKMEDRRIVLLTLENRRLADMVNHKNEVIKVLISMVEDKYPGLTELFTTDEALKTAEPLDIE